MTGCPDPIGTAGSPPCAPRAAKKPGHRSGRAGWGRVDRLVCLLGQHQPMPPSGRPAVVRLWFASNQIPCWSSALLRSSRTIV